MPPLPICPALPESWGSWWNMGHGGDERCGPSVTCRMDPDVRAALVAMALPILVPRVTDLEWGHSWVIPARNTNPASVHTYFAGARPP
jgi:hypothetical protein